MPEKYLSDTDIANRYGIARPTVWRWHRERPDFPRAIHLTPGCTRWRASDLDRWEQAKAEVAA